MKTSARLSLDDLGTHSPTLAGLLENAKRIAQTDSPVLIFGEPGSGRSTLARAIHHAGRRSDGPLVELDPGAVPSALFESEFFGYAEGAFTGAVKPVAGRVAKAEGGSLLLDHVEEIPLAAQPKLLRLLAERRFTVLGGEERPADVRFLAIASEDLPLRVKNGAFREDLYYRLEVLAVRLPPLRERREDIVPLSLCFLADFSSRFGRANLELSPEAGDWMRDYAWPGNLRQLRNVLERAVILGESTWVNPAPEAGAESRPRSLADMEKEQIRQALAYTRGRQGEAATILGISRKTLWDKRRRYGIP